MAEPKMHKVPGKDELQKLDLVPTAKEILKAGNHIYDILNDQGAPEKFRNDFYEAFGQIGYCDEHNNVKWEVQEGLRKLNRVLGQTYNGKPFLTYAVEQNWVSESFQDLIQHANDSVGIQMTFPRAKNNLANENDLKWNNNIRNRLTQAKYEEDLVEKKTVLFEAINIYRGWQDIKKETEDEHPEYDPECEGGGYSRRASRPCGRSV